MLTSLLMSCQAYSARHAAAKEKEGRDLHQAIAMAHALGPQAWQGPQGGWSAPSPQAYSGQKPASVMHGGYGHRACGCRQPQLIVPDSGGPPPYPGRASQSGWR